MVGVRNRKERTGLSVLFPTVGWTLDYFFSLLYSKVVISLQFCYWLLRNLITNYYVLQLFTIIP